MTRPHRRCLSEDMPVRAKNAGVRIPMKVSVLALSCALVATAVSVPAQAGESAPGSLRQQVQILTQRVNTLEAEVRALQHAQAVPPAATPVAQPAAKAAPAEQAAPTVDQSFGAVAQLRHAWNQLKRGMPASAVRKLLGPPSGQFHTGNITVWYYHYTGVGSGSVTISRENRLSDWQAPSRGLF